MVNELNIAGKPPTIVPNVNVSNRPLPRPITASIFAQPIQLDAELQAKFPGDRQLLKISIAKKDLFITDGEVVSLVVQGFDHKLYDKLGSLVKPSFKNDTQTNYDFNFDKVAAINLFLEVANLAGSPVVKSESVFIDLRLFVTHPVFTPVIIDSGADLSIDRKQVLIAPLRFMSNLQGVERLYICELPDNQPTVKELEAALQAIGVAHILDKVPADVCKGDAWLQDQYQEGYCHDDRGNKLRMVLHLPRLRSETADADRPNLSTFVDQYFPSADIGLIKDFWQRKYTVTVSQKTNPITFRDTWLIALTFELVQKFYDSSMAFFRAIGSKGAEGAAPTDVWEQIRYANLLMVLVATEYEKSGKKSPELDNRYALLTEMHKGIEQRFPAIYSDSARMKIQRKDGSAVIDGTVDSTEIRRLHDEYALLHDSVNYGGNIEIAPSTSADEAPRPVIGHSSQRSMDKAILDFLNRQVGNPLEIDTSWLKVGHVDELISFVSTPGLGRKWAILQNSTAVAFTILMEAVRFYFQDKTLDIDKTDWSKMNSGLLNLGHEKENRFVSHVLRGKYWEYAFNRQESPYPIVKPPQMYLMSQGSLFTGAPDVTFDVYPAALSVLEILRLERQFRANRDAQTQLDDLAKLLRNELDSPDIAMMPTIFDLPEGNSTETFLPNPVNLQVVGSHVFMPRPFGPRMKAADAVTVMKNVFHPSMHTLLSTSFITKMKLETQTLNIRNYPATDYHQRIPSSEINVYDYPDTPPDFEERLVQANRTEFTPDGYLKDGWRTLTIPEKTVDLFEFYITVVLSQIGTTVHWIDTWYYHVHHGGLHCGTNCIRKP